MITPENKAYSMAFPYPDGDPTDLGLNIREYFAIRIYAQRIAADHRGFDVEADAAVRAAEALIERLVR